MTSARAVLITCAVLGLAMATPIDSGCALLSRGASVEVGWYTPERTQAPPGRTQRQGSCELHLGRVTSGAALGLRIAYGDGLYRVGYYEGLRWTERPEQYVRRALSRALFEEGPLQRSLTGAAPTLDVEVVEFQEVKAPATHAARVALRLVLAADRVLVERTVAVSEPFPGEPFDAFVAAMSVALETAVNEIVRDVLVTCSPAGS